MYKFNFWKLRASFAVAGINWKEVPQECKTDWIESDGHVGTEVVKIGDQDYIKLDNGQFVHISYCEEIEPETP